MVTACNYHSAFSIHKELRALLSWRSRQFENSFILPHVVILMSQPIGEMSVVRSYGYGSQMSLYIINSCSTVSIAKAKYVNVSTSKLVVYKESPPGAASGMSRCHFFGWLLMSLLSFYHVQLGWNFNMLVSELAAVNWPEELTIYGPGPDLWPLKFWP